MPAGDLRRSRAASENIIPTDTNAARVLEQMMPHLEGKITGLALNVPVPNGSLVDMTMFTELLLPKRRSMKSCAPASPPNFRNTSSTRRPDRFERCQDEPVLEHLRQPGDDYARRAHGEDHRVVRQRLGLRSTGSSI